MPVILVIWEAETGGWHVQGQPEKHGKVPVLPLQKERQVYTETHCTFLVSVLLFIHTFTDPIHNEYIQSARTDKYTTLWWPMIDSVK